MNLYKRALELKDEIILHRRFFHKNAETRDERMAWFREARFGIFIHYGLYSTLGTGEWSQANENYTREEYAALAKSFAPKDGCAREWCELAKKAGAKYAYRCFRSYYPQIHQGTDFSEGDQKW